MCPTRSDATRNCWPRSARATSRPPRRRESSAPAFASDARAECGRSYAAAVGEETNDIEEAPVLSIGSVVGGVGPAARAWDRPLRNLTQRVIEARVGVTSSLKLNVVFHVPGEVVQFDEEYVRTGRYDARSRLLMVQVTVPQAAPDEPDRFLLTRLSEAVGEAEEWVRRRGVADDLPALRELVEGLGK